tara:strand:+ start:14997 stop:15989 length:993 start_codon:yes stop_codon:yes gene_type:complete
MNFISSQKLGIQKDHSFSIIILLMIAFTYSLFVGSGFYGFGNDYYGAYVKGFKWNSPRAGLFDYLGYKISTFRIGGLYFGVYLVTFIISTCTGFLIREHFKFKGIKSLILFLIIFLIAIHTWPVVMSTSNAMRQGLAMSFIFLVLIFSSRKNYYWMISFSIIAALMHKSGPLIISIILFATILNEILNSFPKKRKIIINFFIGIFLLCLSYFILNVFILPDQEPTRIINGDFRAAFVLISLIYVTLSFFYRKILDNSFNLSLYYFSFISLAPLMIGLNWEYERLGMTMLIPYILSFGILLNKSSYKIYLILTFFLLFLLTIYTGMYTSLK